MDAHTSKRQVRGTWYRRGSRPMEEACTSDIGVIGFALAGAGPFPVPVPGTGVIWRVSPQGEPQAPTLSYAPRKTFSR